MSDCGVCLYGDGSSWDGTIDDVQVVTLDHDQKCCECRAVVPAGSKIEEARWYNDGEDGEVEGKDRIYTCLVCAEIAEAFYCGGGGRIYNGDLWKAMDEVMDELTTSCFDRLKTPEAKAKLRRRWMEWKGIQA